VPFLASRRAGFPVSLSLRALAVIWLCLPGPARQRQRQHPPARAPAWAHHRSRSVTAAGPACRPALPCPAPPLGVWVWDARRACAAPRVFASAFAQVGQPMSRSPAVVCSAEVPISFTSRRLVVSCRGMGSAGGGN
jgi:hypothetical protein